MGNFRKICLATPVVALVLTVVFFVFNVIFFGHGPFGKTYRNESLRFSFRYPANYDLVEQVYVVDHFSVSLTLPVIPMLFAPSPAPPIAVDIYDNPGRLPLVNWLSTDPRSNFPKAATSTLGTLDGQTVLFYSSTDPYDQEQAAVAQGDKIYIFSETSYVPTGTVWNDFRFVLSTLKFGKVS